VLRTLLADTRLSIPIHYSLDVPGRLGFSGFQGVDGATDKFIGLGECGCSRRPLVQQTRRLVSHSEFVRRLPTKSQILPYIEDRYPSTFLQIAPARAQNAPISLTVEMPFDLAFLV